MLNMRVPVRALATPCTSSSFAVVYEECREEEVPGVGLRRRNEDAMGSARDIHRTKNAQMTFW